MRYKKTLLILLVLILVFVVGLIMVCRREPVTSEIEAIEIANGYIEKRFGQEFVNCVICDVTLDDGNWIVSYTDESVETKYLAGGGFPMVWIAQDNGQVIKCSFQK